MAEQSGKDSTTRPKRRRTSPFFLNGELHKKLYVNLPQDKIITWNYPQAKRVVYTYSDVRRRREYAYKTREVAPMLNRHWRSLQNAIMNGDIKPHYSYTIGDDPENPKDIKHVRYYFDEAKIMEFHEYFCNRHRGAQRKDNLITPQRMPSARELRAMVRQENLVYIKNEDGEFVPLWKAADFDY